MDLRAALRSLNIPYAEHGSSPHVTQGWLGIQCPFCGRGSRNFGLGINLRTLGCTCWKCGSHSLRSALAEAVGDWKPVRALLPELEAGAERQRPAERGGTYKPPPGVVDMMPAHRRYLERRGFDPDLLALRHGIRGIGGGGRLGWRLFMPVCVYGEPVTWTTRAIGEATMRYISAAPAEESRPLKHCLYGEDHVRHAVVVTEGPFDMLRIGPGAVALFGVSYTPVQVARLARYPVRVIAFDNEPAAQRRANQLADLLAPWPGQTHIARLSGADPDSAPAAEIAELRARFLD